MISSFYLAKASGKKIRSTFSPRTAAYRFSAGFFQPIFSGNGLLAIRETQFFTHEYVLDAATIPIVATAVAPVAKPNPTRLVTGWKR